jgi:hypothetical protein
MASLTQGKVDRLPDQLPTLFVEQGEGGVFLPQHSAQMSRDSRKDLPHIPFRLQEAAHFGHHKPTLFLESRFL